MKVVSLLLFLLGLCILVFTAIVFWQFQDVARSSEPKNYPIVEHAMELLVPVKEGTREVNAAEYASKFSNRLSMVGMVGALVCAIACFAFFTAPKKQSAR